MTQTNLGRGIAAAILLLQKAARENTTQARADVEEAIKTLEGALLIPIGDGGNDKLPLSGE